MKSKIPREDKYFLSHKGFRCKRRAHRVKEISAPRLRIRDPRGRGVRLEEDGAADEDVESRSGGDQPRSL